MFVVLLSKVDPFTNEQKALNPVHCRTLEEANEYSEYVKGLLGGDELKHEILEMAGSKFQ